MVAACNVPVSLYAADTGAGGQREAWRRFLHGSLNPLALVVADELGKKLDQPDLQLDLSRTFASDLTGRARAVSSLIQAGIPVEEAMTLAGLTTD